MPGHRSLQNGGVYIQGAGIPVGQVYQRVGAGVPGGHVYQFKYCHYGLKSCGISVIDETEIEAKVKLFSK